MRPLVGANCGGALEPARIHGIPRNTQKFMHTRAEYSSSSISLAATSRPRVEVSASTAIRALSSSGECKNSRKPLSDSQLSEILGQQGIVVARGTVAKYASRLQIFVNLRKTL